MICMSSNFFLHLRWWWIKKVILTNVVMLGRESDLDNMEKDAVRLGWKVSLMGYSEHSVWMYLYITGVNGWTHYQQ